MQLPPGTIRLTQSQIKEAFPEEIQKIIPRLLIEYNKPVKIQAQMIKNVMFTERFVCMAIKSIYYNISWEEDQIRRLNACFTQQNQPQLNDSRVSEQMIEQAKLVPLTAVYTFERLKQSSQGRLMALCPVHTEKTPSFVIYLPNKGAHCFSCGWSCQDTIAFVMKVRGLSFPQAVRLLCAA